MRHALAIVMRACRSRAWGAVEEHQRGSGGQQGARTGRCSAGAPAARRPLPPRACSSLSRGGTYTYDAERLLSSSSRTSIWWGASSMICGRTTQGAARVWRQPPRAATLAAHGCACHRRPLLPTAARARTLYSVSSPPSKECGQLDCKQCARAATSSGHAARPEHTTTTLMHVPAVWRRLFRGLGSRRSSASCTVRGTRHARMSAHSSGSM